MRGGAGEVGVVGEEKQVFNEEQDCNMSKQKNSVSTLMMISLKGKRNTLTRRTAKTDVEKMGEGV